MVVAIAAPEFIEFVAPGIFTATEAAAVGGGIASAATKAATGGNLEQVLVAGAEGAAASYAGAEVGQAVGGAVGGEQAGPFLDSSGQVIPGPDAASGIAGETGSQAAGNIVGKGGVGGFTQGFTKAELGGQNLEKSLRAREIGGANALVTAGIGELLRDAATPSEIRTAKALSGSLLAPTIASLFTDTSAPQTPTRTTRQTTAGGLPTTGTRTVGGGGTASRYIPAVGSAALGQALGVGGAQAGTGSTGGYGAGGESLSPETGGKQQTVWNIESLRVKPEES